jgi:serine phosphatase RsbU (regulator of sigma subunit)
MKLRTRLIIAFLLLSVLPLTAVTLYSYNSSLRAFHRTVEAEAASLAAEMESRMDVVTADLGQRVDRLWEVPMQAATADGQGAREGRAPTQAPPADVNNQIALALGAAAGFLDRLEFVPAVQATEATAPTSLPKAPQAGPTSGVAPTPPVAPPAPPAPPPVVIDLRPILADAAKNDPDAQRAAERAQKLLQDLQARYGPLADLGMRGAALGLRIGATELQRLATERARTSSDREQRIEHARKAFAELKGGYLGLPVTRGGRRVGEIKAKLNLSQVLRSVLSLTRRDQGEVPFAIDDENHIYTVDPGDQRKLEPLRISAAGAAGGVTPTWIVVTRKDARGVTFGIARPIGDSLAEIRRASVRNLGLGLFVIAIALLGIYPISTHMTRNVTSLTNGVRAIAHGDLGARVPVRSSDEFGELAKAFNQMTTDLAAHQKLVVEQERMHRELELCRQIQNEMLPHERLWLGLTEVKGVSIPAREVGGDFFNYFLLPDGQMALLVGDVSGKGVGAALLMANIQATLRARLPLEPDLAKLIDAIDRDVDDNTPGGVFLTLFVGILDPQQRTLRYVNAGHNPQYVLRTTGAIERMPGTGLPVGLFAGHGYAERSIVLEEADLIFFYTDGMVEVENESGDLYGAERLEALLVRAHDAGIDDLLAQIEASVRSFRGRAEPFDDATMMALRFRRT